MSDNLMDKIKNTMKSLEGVIKVPSVVKDYRMNICDSCEHIINLTKTCKKCGCFMEAKTWLPAARCPINKWGKHTMDTITEKYLHVDGEEVSTNMSLAELENFKNIVESSNNFKPGQSDYINFAIQQLKNK